MNRILRGHKGFSLIEIMLAGAAIIGIGVTLLKMNENTNKSIKYSEKNLEIISLVKEIRSTLSSSGACHNSFSGMNAKNETGITQIKNSSGVVVFETNKNYGTVRLKINSIELSDSSDEVSVVTGGSGTTLLKLVFNRGEKSNSVKLITKNIRMNVNTASDDTITGCTAFSAVESSLWDKSTADPDNIYYQGGNVGIGNDNPQATLDVTGIVKVQSLKHVWKDTNISDDGYSIVVGENITLNATTAGYGLTLPSDATHGDIIKFLHGAGDLSVNNITISRGKATDSVVGDPNLILDLNNISIDLFFYDPDGDGAGDWRLY